MSRRWIFAFCLIAVALFVWLQSSVQIRIDLPDAGSQRPLMASTVGLNLALTVILTVLLALLTLGAGWLWRWIMDKTRPKPDIWS